MARNMTRQVGSASCESPVPRTHLTVSRSGPHTTHSIWLYLTSPQLAMLLLVAGFLLYICSLASCQDDQLQTTYQDSLATAVAQFTQSVYVHLAKTSDQENFVFSPLSLHSALSMVYFGSELDSATYEELQLALGGFTSQRALKEGRIQLGLELRQTTKQSLCYHLQLF